MSRTGKCSSSNRVFQCPCKYVDVDVIFDAYISKQGNISIPGYKW